MSHDQNRNFLVVLVAEMFEQWQSCREAIGSLFNWEPFMELLLLCFCCYDTPIHYNLMIHL